MFDRFTLSFSLSVIEDGVVLVLALTLMMRRQFRPIGYWLIAYAISALYGDYHFGVETRQKALGSAVGHAMILSANVSFVVDLLGRIALLVAIWIFFRQVLKARPEERTDSRSP